jgi:biotin carboxyl carrier protein
MKYTVQFQGKSDQTRVVQLERDGDRWRLALEHDLSESTAMEAVEISRGVYSILLDGESWEIQVAEAADGRLIVQTGRQEFNAEVADPRSWKGRRQGGAEAQGRQQILAPMPGKVVRVLVKVGDKVEAKQGLLVVEAMKMQNEIRSPKSGTVERVLVKDGQAVNAGEVLALID